jgi:hypothetical protein
VRAIVEGKCREALAGIAGNHTADTNPLLALDIILEGDSEKAAVLRVSIWHGGT